MLCGGAEAFKEEIGFNDLAAEYTGTLPNGAGVKVSMAEADTNKDNPDVIHQYLPSSTEPQLLGVTITNGSSVSTPQVSSHATGMARTFFGSTSSVAPGVTQATVYEANHFLNSILKLTPTNAGPPDTPTYKVQNHSWIGSFEDRPDLDLEALQRLDYSIDTYDVTTAVGLNNGSGGSHPALFSHSYNSLGVGRTDGNHSRGLTPFASYGAGRIKPDIVAPMDTTSSATAVISSVATMLYQSATDTVNFPNADPDAAKSETMKAILMAGATKDEFPGWENADPEQPLDLIYGAGEVNVRNSFYIQQAGQWDAATQAGGPAMGDYGWDYGDVASGGSNFYELVVPRFFTGTELSVVLAWNVEVTDTNAGSTFSPVHSLANLDLRLYDSTGTPIETELAASTSTKDNVEHVYLKNLAEGNYSLEVRSVSGSRDYGLAWRLDNQAPYRVSGDYNLDGVVDSADYSLWRDTFGSTEDLAADGDLSGVVDDGDYHLWRSAYGTILEPPIVAAPSFAAAVSAPEPTTLMLLVSLLGGGLLTHRRRR